MKIVITDVNVFFDLFELKILPQFFDLDWEILTTDFVLNEIVYDEQIKEFEEFKRLNKLRVIKVTSDEVALIRQFELKRPNKSFPDKTALWHAKKMQCILLTGDGALRTEAEHQKIEVHGSIWVLLQLLENEIIHVSQTIELLNDLKRLNTRLPKNEIDKIISKLKQKTESNGM